ncbi:hypothetical protein ACN28S_52625 [Cystobacter fuscus]
MTRNGKMLVGGAVVAVLGLGALGVFVLRTPGGAGAVVDAAALSQEARVNVLRLCGDAQAYRDENGVFLAAGPVPAQVPRGGQSVPFSPDENMRKLGFDPGEHVRHQYQVVVQETPWGRPRSPATREVIGMETDRSPSSASRWMSTG